MDAKTKLEELSLELVVEQNKSKTIEDEKKIDEDNLTSANEELANLTKVMANLESKLQNKYKIKSDLATKLEKVKKKFRQSLRRFRKDSTTSCCVVSKF